MSQAIRLSVNLHNPGQFLACGGLMELATCLDPDALAWFEEGQFVLQLEAPEELLRISSCPIESAEKPFLGEPSRECGPEPESSGQEPPSAEETGGEPETVEDEPKCPEASQEGDDNQEEKAGKSAPIILGDPFHLRLDWWEEQAMSDAGFKTWSGGQTVQGFLKGMRPQFPTQWTPDCLTSVQVVTGAKPFSFDSRLSRMTARDMGFSTEKFATAFSPAVELLAFIGLQRFRPWCVSRRERYGFTIWKDPLPINIAAAVAAGLLSSFAAESFTFPIIIRTGGKYKALGAALPERNTHV